MIFDQGTQIEVIILRMVANLKIIQVKFRKSLGSELIISPTRALVNGKLHFYMKLNLQTCFPSDDEPEYELRTSGG